MHPLFLFLFFTFEQLLWGLVLLAPAVLRGVTALSTVQTFDWDLALVLVLFLLPFAFAVAVLAVAVAVLALAFAERTNIHWIISFWM